jgi:predicted O-linked N-acetylglucosamine transferase (SPINDLY family)
MAVGKAKLKQNRSGIRPVNQNKPFVVTVLESALSHHKDGRLSEARALYEKALALDPNNPDAHQLLGVLVYRQGDTEYGLKLLQRAIELDPSNAVARNNLGGVLRAVGQNIAAEREFTEALRLMPDYPDALANRSAVLCDLERFDEAATGLRRAVQLDPNHLDARRNLARVYMKMRRFSEAETELRYYLQFRPDHDEEVSNLAFSVQQQGRFEEAQGLFNRALHLAKDNPSLLQNLRSLLASDARTEQERLEFREELRRNPGMRMVEVGVAVNLFERGKHDQARQIFDDILEVHGNDPDVWSDVGATILTLGKYNEAEKILDRALEMDPESTGALHNLASIYLFTNRMELAVQTFRRTLILDPTSATTAVGLARSLFQLGNFDQAHFFARAALDTPTIGKEQTPSLQGIFHALCDFEGLDRLGDIWENANRLQLGSLLTLYLNLLPVVRNRADMEKFKALVAKWANHTEVQALHAPLPPFPQQRPPSPDGRIRLGILSADLRSHSVSRFLLPFVQGHDRSKISLHCYTPLPADNDPYQMEYRKASDHFVFVNNMTPREIAERIRKDNVDVLLELNGFTYESRVAAMSYKPAPVQMSWIGYPATCGLKAIDYVVLDRFVNPTDESSFVEEPLVMPEAYVCFGKFPEEPIEPTLPMDRNGCVTFGTLNNPYKYNRETIALWAKIMAQVPNSRFLLVRHEASSVVLCANLVAEFAKHGIGADRLFLFDNRTENRNHLSYYNDIDISLDTFPLTGGTTTCEATWMGVPVVSLVGDYNHQRISYSVLMHCGLEELCVFTPEDYVARAVALAGEREKLAIWRTGLREVMRESPLCDEPRFLYQFQEMLEQVAQLHGLR